MPDLYRLTAEQLLEIEGYGEISARNAVAAIQASKEPAVLPGPLRPQHPRRRLGDGSEPRPSLRARSTASWKRARRRSRRSKGIGPERAEAIAEWFSDEENRRLVAELRELGLTFEAGEAEKPVEGRPQGQTYVDHGNARGLDARGGDRGRSRSSARRSRARSRRRPPGSWSPAKSRARSSGRLRRPACRSSTSRRSRRCSAAD